MRTTKTVSKALTACAAISLSLGLGMGAANAIPPGGASSNSPDTSSTVSPHVRPGGVINFTLKGFPANTEVSIKIDNGDTCPADAPHGACVVHKQTTNSEGKLNGSFILPSVSDGEHTLRFLATGERVDGQGRKLGTRPYTNQSPTFSVGESDNGAAIMAPRQITEGPLRAAPILRPTITPDLKVRVIMVPKITAVTRHRTVVHLSKRPSILMLMATLSLKKSMIV
ncbi:Uncharacterised protein [Rothia dentocariosa]|uniref:Uncharacterized protein n=1 Tax=Rothia dentocariosa TaxID=2047 RepID=A0A448UUS4_9MICC|nr:Uncharacterised protein [Rothia dentocariosa]